MELCLYPGGKELRASLKNDLIDGLFKKYYNEAVLYTMSICRNEALAEDIVSEAFFKALSSADESIRNFKPWLLAVCRNEFLMYCRTRSRMADDEISEEAAVQEDDTLNRIIRQEEYRALYKAISLLPENLKEPVILFYFNGLSVKEIAAVVGKSEANVKVLLHRAREALRKNMEGIR